MMTINFGEYEAQIENLNCVDNISYLTRRFSASDSNIPLEGTVIFLSWRYDEKVQGNWYVSDVDIHHEYKKWWQYESNSPTISHYTITLRRVPTPEGKNKKGE